MSDNSIHSLRPTATEIGKAFRVDDALGRYNVFVKGAFPRQRTLDGMRIALDCANGSAYRVAPEVLSELGASVTAMGVDPDGQNINHDCGALHPEKLGRIVVEKGCHLGVALDGDADRAIFVDETGAVVDGDEILTMAAADLLRQGTLAKNTVVATVMSNLGVDLAIEGLGGHVVRTPVGDRYVVEEMQRGGYNVGGEQSGHLVFLDHTTTGDGLITALFVLARDGEHGATVRVCKVEADPASAAKCESPKRSIADLRAVQLAIRRRIEAAASRARRRALLGYRDARPSHGGRRRWRGDPPARPGHHQRVRAGSRGSLT
jgi:phosphoglucosamine mutase